MKSALTTGDLKLARSELDKVPADSFAYAAVKHAYNAAASDAVDALISELNAAKRPDCAEYNAVVARARETYPTKLITEATHHSPCTVAKCDASTLAAQGADAYQAGDLKASLAAYERAYACSAAPTMLQRALVIACNLHDLAKSRQYWRRMPASLRTPAALSACVRNGISEEVLNVP